MRALYLPVGAVARVERPVEVGTFEQDFAAGLDGTDYAVVVTEEGESNGLFVTGKGPKGFTVKEKKGGTSGVAFSYRVVATTRRAAGEPARGDAAPSISLPKDVSVPEPPKARPMPEMPKPDAPESPERARQ